MGTRIFVEGAAQGPDSKLLQSRCREGFRKLLEKGGFVGRLPQIISCGSRSSAFNDFKIAHENASKESFVALLVDSEDPVEDVEQTWSHLRQRDAWQKPRGATDDQVLLMTTCMETWIITDRKTLHEHYGSQLQESALPSLHDMESRNRHTIQDALMYATRNCSNAYQKGKRSFEVLAKLEPAEIRKHLDSFVRYERILNERL